MTGTLSRLALSGFYGRRIQPAKLIKGLWPLAKEGTAFFCHEGWLGEWQTVRNHQHQKKL